MMPIASWKTSCRNRIIIGGLISDWTNGTIDRIVDIMETAGTISEGGMSCTARTWDRSGRNYRDHAAPNKYHVVKVEG